MQLRFRYPGARMSEVLPLLIDRVDTPIGEMLIVADRQGNLRAVDWADHETRMRRLLRLHYGENGFRLEPARNPNGLTYAISSYFAGGLAAIDFLPVQTGGTPFQRELWCALRKIPCGTTVSYGKLAEQIGRPAAVRAVGLANGSNPVGVVVPCHRVSEPMVCSPAIVAVSSASPGFWNMKPRANDEANAASSILIFVNLCAAARKRVTLALYRRRAPDKKRGEKQSVGARVR
jgi:methylated-DNA-[protein]-cysteine S-methyltransferase